MAPFEVQFWGVRGSIATPGHAWARYGGNTSCVEVRVGPHRLVLDGGTGLRALGAHLDGEGVDLDILLTHTHVDHLCGIPFFAPLYRPSSTVHVWGGHLGPSMALHEVLDGYMAAPLFPIAPGVFTASVHWHDFEAGQVITPRPGLEIRTAPLRHPNGATGYRITWDGRSVCYVTDTEHQPGRLDPNVLDLIAGADLVIYDCTYTDAEYPQFAGWGHSTWEEGVRLVRAAGAGRLVIFHHDPAHDDAFMDAVAAAAERARPGTVVAREGLVLPVGRLGT